MSAAGPWMTEVRELKAKLKKAYRLLELSGLGYYPSAEDVARELEEAEKE
jgi:hypothetical protein